MDKFSNSNQKLGIFFTLTAAILWGFSGACGQYLFANYPSLNSNLMVSIRLLTSGLIILIALYIKEGMKIFDIIKDKKDFFKLLIYSVVGITTCQYSYFTAIQYSNVGIATVLQYIGPSLILIYISIKNKKFPAKFEALSFLFALFGIFLLSTHGSLDSIVIPKIALFWGVISAFALVINTLLPVPLLKKYSSANIMGWGMFLGGILINIIFRTWNYSLEIDLKGIFFLFIIIIFGTVIAFVSYLSGIKYIGPKKASLISCLEPVSAVFFSIVWHKVKFYPVDLIGIILIIVSVLVTTIFSNPKKTEETEEI